MNNLTIVSWNVRDAAKDDFIMYVRGLIEQFNPDILLFTETRVSEDNVDLYFQQLHFDGWFVCDTIRGTGGIWLLWNSVTVG